MQTDTLTRDERKLQIAAAVGTDHVAEVSLDIRRMRELGVLVDVESRSPQLTDPLTEAIGQLLRYSNQRIAVQEPEGAEQLFRYAQFLVATCFETARVGIVGAPHKLYLAWKDTYPVQTSEVFRNLGGLTKLSQQHSIAPRVIPQSAAGRHT
jgi:hypothetical protein